MYLQKIYRIPFLLICCLVAQWAQAFTELDFDFSYSKDLYGASRQSYDRTRSYGGSITFYFMTLTGIEFNMSQTENEIFGKYNNTGVTTGLVIDNESTNITTQSFGVGIRQAFASRKSFFQPLISLGWSRQIYTLRSKTLVKDLDAPEDILIDSGEEKSSYDAMFAAFALKFRITQTLALKGSVKTVFRAFEFGEARDRLSYSAGFSWMF